MPDTNYANTWRNLFILPNIHAHQLLILCLARVPGPETCLLRSVLDEVSALLASVPWQPALMRPERRAARATFHYVDFFQSFSLIFSFDSCCVSLGTFVPGLFSLTLPAPRSRWLLGGQQMSFWLVKKMSLSNAPKWGGAGGHDRLVGNVVVFPSSRS